MCFRLLKFPLPFIKWYECSNAASGSADPLPIDNRPGKAAMRFKGIIRDDTRLLESQTLVEPGRPLFSRRIEGQERPATVDRQPFGLQHQATRNPLAAVAYTGHQFGDLGPMWLIGRAVKEKRNRCDQRLPHPGAQHDTLAAVRRRQRSFPECGSRLRRQRMHVTDRTTVRDNIDEEVRQIRNHLRLTDKRSNTECGHHRNKDKMPADLLEKMGFPDAAGQKKKGK